ncbi:mCG144607, partial [Mus musculus]
LHLPLPFLWLPVRSHNFHIVNPATANADGLASLWYIGTESFRTLFSGRSTFLPTSSSTHPFWASTPEHQRRRLLSKFVVRCAKPAGDKTG